MGVVALVFAFRRRMARRSVGMLLIGVAFIVSAFLGILLGYSVTTYLLGLLSPYEYGVYLIVVGLVSASTFTALMLVALYMLHREMNPTP